MEYKVLMGEAFREFNREEGNHLDVARVLRNPNDAKSWKSITTRDEARAFNSYWNTAGEAEARNAVLRSTMSMEDRRTRLPDETMDVAPEDLIYLDREAGGGGDAMAPYRRPGAPNNAESKGQLRDGNVPHPNGFMQWAKLGGKGLYADYEFLYGKHPEYFASPEEARAVVEFVLASPEPAGKSEKILPLSEEIQKPDIIGELKSKHSPVQNEIIFDQHIG